MKSSSAQAGFTILETLFVVAIVGVIAAIAVPQLGNSLAYFRISGDARSVSNAIAVTKMRAAANFSKTRLYVSVNGRWHRIETADSTLPNPHWTADGGTTYLSGSTSFGYGVVSTPPPNTQGTIGQAAACKDDTGADIANTACIIFNSRGVPIDSAGSSTNNGAIYVTDGTAVYAVTVAATGMIRMWKTPPTSTPSWLLQ